MKKRCQIIGKHLYNSEGVGRLMQFLRITLELVCQNHKSTLFWLKLDFLMNCFFSENFTRNLLAFPTTYIFFLGTLKI